MTWHVLLPGKEEALSQRVCSLTTCNPNIRPYDVSVSSHPRLAPLISSPPEAKQPKTQVCAQHFFWSLTQSPLFSTDVTTAPSKVNSAQDLRKCGFYDSHSSTLDDELLAHLLHLYPALGKVLGTSLIKC